MNIRVFVLAVFVGIAIAEPDNPRKVGLPLVFPTSIYNNQQKSSSHLLRSGDEIEGINFSNIGVTARPYYRLPPFEEVSMYSRINRDKRAKPPMPVDYNMKVGNTNMNFWPFEKTNNQDNEYNRMLGDISGYSWNSRPRETKKPVVAEVSKEKNSNKRQKNTFKKPTRPAYPLDGADGKFMGDISGGYYWRPNRPYRKPINVNGQNGQGFHQQNGNAHSNIKWFRREDDVYDEDEQFPHFPNHAEYF